MSAGELAAVIASVVSVVAVILAVVLATRSLTLLRANLDELRRENHETRAELRDLQRSFRPVGAQLEAVPIAERDAIVVSSSRSTRRRRDRPSRLAQVAFSDPVIKVMAAATGTRRAAQVLRED